MTLALRRTLRSLPILAAALCLFTLPAESLSIYAVSGQVAPGGPDPVFRRLSLATSCGVGFPVAFGPADFAAADASGPATRIQFPHPLWGTSIPCEPNAAWIGADAVGTPVSAMYSVDFDLPETCCFTAAALDFCWLVDDYLGDSINPAGIYLNGVSIASVSGGNYATETAVGGINVTSLLHCGKNTLYIYDVDAGCAISGVMIGALLQVTECVTPTEGTSWGSVKATYR